MIFRESCRISSSSTPQHRRSFLSFSSSSSSSSILEPLDDLWRDAVLTQSSTVLKAKRSFFVSLLRRSIHRQSLADGKKAHFHILKQGLDQDLHVSNLLLQMYGNCGALHDAEKFFQHMEQKDLYSWRFLIRAYVKDGRKDKALSFFFEMLGRGFFPDNPVICTIISACYGKQGIYVARVIHAFIAECVLNPSVSVYTSLLSTYGKYGFLIDANSVFSQLIKRDVVCWNAMISSYVSKEENMKAIGVFYEMNIDGIQPDRSSFLSVLTACASQKSLIEGMLVHVCIIEGVFEDDVGVANALVNMYGNCDSLEDAQSVFNKISAMDVVSWNAMIAGFVRNDQDKEALLLFGKMQMNGVVPSNVTFIAILSGLSSSSTLDQGKMIHHFIVCNECDQDIVIENSLVSMYGKCGGISDAKTVFDKSNCRDRVSWTAMLTAYTQGGRGEHAMALFDQMQHEGLVPDRVTFISLTMAFTCDSMLYKGKQTHARILSCGFVNDLALENGLVTMYGKCGSVEYAKTTFQKMRRRDLLSWNAVISACVQNEVSDDALKLVNKMVNEGIFPDKFLCSSVMSACASAGAQERGKEMHFFAVINSYELDQAVGNATINMYAKFGSVADSYRVFQRMPRQDIVSWSAIIAAYAQHGYGKYAVDLYNRMLDEGVSADKISLIHLLSACSHDGLVDEALRQFMTVMNEDCKIIIIDHFNCMVDILGRAGRLDDAEKLLLELPFKYSSVAWTTLLGACRSQVDLVRGERAANRVFELDPEATAPYITLSNLYFSAGRVDDALNVIKRMRQKGLVKQADGIPIEVLGERASNG